MRVGRSEEHDKKYQGNKTQNRVIIPLYIPNEEGYYKDSSLQMVVLRKYIQNYLNYKIKA